MSSPAAHEILGVSRFADEKAIRAAHRSLLREHQAILNETRHTKNSPLHTINAARDEMLQNRGQALVPMSINPFGMYMQMAAAAQQMAAPLVETMIKTNFEVWKMAGDMVFSTMFGGMRSRNPAHGPSSTIVARYH